MFSGIAAIVRTAVVVFSIFSPQTENPDRVAFAAHLQLVADMPEDYALSVWDAAHMVGVDPVDLAVTCFTEHSARVWDLSAEGFVRRRLSSKRVGYSNRDGAAGELGWCQTMPRWRVKAKEEVPFLAELNDGAGPTDDDVRNDPLVASVVAAYVIQKAHESHAEHADMKFMPEGEHEWIAHYKCAPYRGKEGQGRGYKCGTCGFSKRKWARARASFGAFLTPRVMFAEHVRTWHRYCSRENP
jgi:hypothetical protein